MGRCPIWDGLSIQRSCWPLVKIRHKIRNQVYKPVRKGGPWVNSGLSLRAMTFCRGGRRDCISARVCRSFHEERGHILAKIKSGLSSLSPPCRLGTNWAKVLI